MTSLKPLPWRQAYPAERSWSQPVRRFTAAGLQIASASLARLAEQVAAPASRAVGQAPAQPTLEFYAEASAPEGALYLDGELVGWLTGVRRL